MNREVAIAKLAFRNLNELSEEERKEQLEIMTMEGWDQVADWRFLPMHIQKEFEEGALKENSNDEIYDQVLLIWLRECLMPVTNKYICKKLELESIHGEPIKLVGCPCCASRTLSGRGHYDICKVCWWEDDGQDNRESDKVYGGPNQELSLTQIRFNFLKFGIYNPERKDLMVIKEPFSKYVTGRIFKLINGWLIEEGTNWKSQKFNQSPTIQ